VFVGSYGWMALDHGQIWLWNVIVHESGRYTFGETVLYFSHFLREIPTAIAYALFLMGAAGGVGAAPAMQTGRRRHIMIWTGLLGAGLLVLAAVFVSAGAHGWDSAIQDLAQFRTRDDLEAYGSHWHFHWLSTIWFGVAAGLAPAGINRLAGAPLLRPSRRWTLAAWSFFVALTVVFGLSVDVFTDVRYAGHQAREILTHGPVTLLFGIAILLAASRPPPTPSPAPAGAKWAIWLKSFLFLSIPLFLAVVALSGDVMTAGQSDHGLAAMVGAHYFEHTLDYLLIALLLLAGIGGQIAHRSRQRDERDCRRADDPGPYVPRDGR
jgi:hypothetical protein